MSKDEHLSWLLELWAMCYLGGVMITPQKEGAFYFNGSPTLPEYIKLYREECIKEGWIDE